VNEDVHEAPLGRRRQIRPGGRVNAA
jgi:hypothetical protein